MTPSTCMRFMHTLEPDLEMTWSSLVEKIVYERMDKYVCMYSYVVCKTFVDCDFECRCSMLVNISPIRWQSVNAE